MSVDRYETEAHKKANKAHERAQQTGRAVDYITAADLYNKSGDYDAERACRDAADRLAK